MKSRKSLVFILLGSCVGPLAAPGNAQAPAKTTETARAPQPAQIDRNGVLILLRSTLLALHQANETGNYTVLRDIGSPGFQQVNTAARLAEIFATVRNQRLDLSGAAVLDPQLTLLPQIEANGMMHLAGFFPSIPLQINFDLLFAPVDGRWRPYGISIGVAQASPVAPAASSPPPGQKTDLPNAGSDGTKRSPPSARPPANSGRTGAAGEPLR